MVEIINEWATTPQDVSTRPWTGYPGADSAVRQQLMDVWPSNVAEPDDESIARACDHVYPIFTVRWPAETANYLNRAIVGYGMVPRLTGAQDGVRMRWSTSHVEQFLTAILVASLLEHINAAPRDRFGICESTSCADVLVDQSPTHTKHFCSARCQTRERVRSFRSRKPE
ncbi:CGNR zinc finger domain-containing protein [Brevibacterium luteolum]|uniref:CGNR zinc finger domain-containing protein n=1 Tax=Brevibacterium luteolum TaxID=199591 RepID=UPI003879751D|nr:CGNR zinc finger domain-containing protein [Brevibacterium luteolum]